MQSQAEPVRDGESALRHERADLADGATDGGGAHLVDHAECLVGEAGAQVNQGGQQPVSEDESVPRAGPGLPSARAPAPFVPRGLAARFPAWREFFDWRCHVG